MNGTDASLDSIPGSSESPEFLYTVLNLPKTSSEYEIRERYRQLSVLFHPDKQHDESTRETATKRFLEVQKAYQVLSDPLSRRAYDILGPEGLKTIHDADLSTVPPEEFEKVLVRKTREHERDRIEQLLRSKGRLTVGIDATPLFDERYNTISSWYERISTRLTDIRHDVFRIRHNVQKDIGDKTLLILSSRAASGVSGGVIDPRRTAVMGTVRHQYSPRLEFEATTNLLRASRLGLKTTYHDDDNTVLCELSLTRALFDFISLSSQGTSAAVLPGSIAYSRRLFADSPVQGTVMFSTANRYPALTIALNSERVFDHTAESSVPQSVIGESTMLPPSGNGLAIGVGFWNVQLSISGLLSGIRGECGLALAELGLRLKVGLQLALNGLTGSLGGEWRRGANAIGTTIAVGIQGVFLELDLSYLGQQVNIPITLADDRDLDLAFWTAAMPSTALILTYFLVLRPRRQKARQEFFREARHALHAEKSELLRETKETVHLLEDIAKRHMQTEQACNGLVILEATYSPMEKDEATEGLDVDVTVPLQALVHRSQLYIPGRRSKAGLQGFYDPAPGVAKALRIRYTFHGRMHYGEVPDWLPVVLPLEEHLVD